MYGQCYNASALSGSEFWLTYKPFSAITALTDGGFVVTFVGNGWPNTNAFGFGVYGQRFDANSNKIAVMVSAQPTTLPSTSPTFFQRNFRLKTETKGFYAEDHIDYRS